MEGKTYMWIGAGLAVPLTAWLLYRFLSKRAEKVEQGVESTTGSGLKNLPETSKNIGRSTVSFVKGIWDEIWGITETADVNPAGG